MFKNIYDSTEEIEVSFSVSDTGLYRLPFGRLFTTHEIWTGTGKTGTQLVDNTDYLVGGTSARAGEIKGESVYSGFQITNAGYHATTLYATILWIGTILTAEIMDDIETVVLHTITDATDVTVALPTAVNEQREFTYFRTGSGAGKVLFTTESSQTINGDAASVWTLEGEGNISLVSDGSNWQVREYSDSGSNANGTWKKLIDGSMEETVLTTNLSLPTSDSSHTIALPKTFINTDFIFTAPFGTPTDHWDYFTAGAQDWSSAANAKFVVRNNGIAQTVNNIRFSATGRWKA